MFSDILQQQEMQRQIQEQQRLQAEGMLRIQQIQAVEAQRQMQEQQRFLQEQMRNGNM